MEAARRLDILKRNTVNVASKALATISMIPQKNGEERNYGKGPYNENTEIVILSSELEERGIKLMFFSWNP